MCVSVSVCACGSVCLFTFFGVPMWRILVDALVSACDTETVRVTPICCLISPTTNYVLSSKVNVALLKLSQVYMHLITMQVL